MRVAARLYWVMRQFGFDPRALLRACRALPKFVADYRRFLRIADVPVRFLPSLQDHDKPAGIESGEYFWQDLYVARLIFAADPMRHVDVGSRIDGFIAHLASFREVELFDVRPLPEPIPGVRFVQRDLSDSAQCEPAYADSVSCLHALEHFGLGRYGDPVSGDAYVRGLANLARIVCSGGALYLSVPVGCARVEFNSHRILDPARLLDIARDNQLVLERLAVIEPHRHLVEMRTPGDDFLRLKDLDYALAVLCFRKQ